MAKHYLNLSKVLKDLLNKKNMRPADLANAVDLPRPTIHRLLTGKSTRPHSSSLEPIAEYFSVDVEQLLGEKPLVNSETLIKSNVTDQIEVKYVPLIEWKLIGDISSKCENHKCIPFIGSISEKGFATIMPDTSMEPFIRKNSILIFEPEKKVKDRSFALIKLEGNKLLFRQVLIDLEDVYLKALNKDLDEIQMRLLDKNDVILGILLESRINFEEVE